MVVWDTAIIIHMKSTYTEENCIKTLTKKKDTVGENQPLKVYIQSEHEIRIISEQFDVCMIKSLGFATTLGDNLNVNSPKKIKNCFLIKTETCIPFT